MALIDFTLSNARRFYSSMGNPSGLKGLTKLQFTHPTFPHFEGVLGGLRLTFKRFLHLNNIRSTKVEGMLGKCWTQKQSCAEAVQMVPTLRQQKNQHFREI